MNNPIYLDLKKYIEKHTAHCDDSHNINHAICVYNNAIKIAEIDYPKYDYDIVLYASLLHDVCDHKYINTLTKEELNIYIKSKLSSEKAQIVIDIIDNVSYSNEIKGRMYLDLLKNIQRNLFLLAFF